MWDSWAPFASILILQEHSDINAQVSVLHKESVKICELLILMGKSFKCCRERFFEVRQIGIYPCFCVQPIHFSELLGIDKVEQTFMKTLMVFLFRNSLTSAFSNLRTHSWQRSLEPDLLHLIKTSKILRPTPWLYRQVLTCVPFRSGPSDKLLHLRSAAGSH